MPQLKRAKSRCRLSGPVCNRDDSKAILNAASSIATEFGVIDGAWNGECAISCCTCGGLDMGFIPDSKGMDTKAMLKAKSGQLDMLYLLAADEMVLDGIDKLLAIYQGSHGDAGARIADVTLPAACVKRMPCLSIPKAVFSMPSVRLSRPVMHVKTGRSSAHFPQYWAKPSVLITMMNCVKRCIRQSPVLLIRRCCCQCFLPQAARTITSTPLQHASGRAVMKLYDRPTSRHSTTMAAH